MTEAEWLASHDPDRMLGFLRREFLGEGRGRNARRILLATSRKPRLFAVACYRSAWTSIPPAHRYAAKVAEGYADGLATEDDLMRAYARKWREYCRFDQMFDGRKLDTELDDDAEEIAEKEAE